MAQAQRRKSTPGKTANSFIAMFALMLAQLFEDHISGKTGAYTR
jgi:hypothetical protein